MRGGPTQRVLRQVVPCQIENPLTGQKVWTYAILDGGSQTTCVTPRLVRELGLREHGLKMSLTTFGCEVPAERETAMIHLRSYSMSLEYKNHHVCVGTLPVMKQEIPTQEMVDSYLHLNGVKLDVLPDHRYFVDVLVGADLAMGLVPAWVCRGSKSTPCAYLTLFGWGLTGPVGKRSDSPLDCFFVALDNEQLAELMRAQYEHDFMVDF
jgi:hypothetical protein